jgi:DNA-binding response OmpR family regulator
LRTPLGAVIGYSEMLLDDATDQGQENVIPDLQKIHAAGNDLLTHLNAILDPATIDAGKLNGDLESVGATLRHDLRTPITTVIGYCEMLLEDAADRGQHDLMPDLERMHAAAQRFLALIDNIVHVATTDAGTVVGELASTALSSMAQEVVHTIRPLQGDGTPPRPAPCGTVLIVDDDVVNRDILSRHLERQGHTVAVAENGRQALEMVAARPFDLVLLDVMMPELNGYQVLRYLKADATWHDIPVIMISALDEIDTVVRCIELGAEEYVPKPFNPTLLRARIGACLEKKRLRDQELAYLRTVARVTEAAAAVEAGAFAPASLEDVAARRDALGRLARVFQRMAREVRAREERLQQQVQELRIQIDEGKKAREVAEITETDYFRTLQEKARRLRAKE